MSVFSVRRPRMRFRTGREIDQTPQHILHEEEIVWEQDPIGLRYVRETVTYAHTRRRRPSFGGNLIGYATLDNDAEPVAPRTWERRVFYLMPHDPYPRQSYPIEAKDPMTLMPGELGKPPL